MMQVATIDEIRMTNKQNFEKILLVLDEITDSELNMVVFAGKRTIGELISHILQITSLPLFMEVFLYKHKFTLELDRIDAKNYNWDTKNGKGRKISTYNKSDLILKIKKRADKRNKKLENTKDSHRKYLHMSTLHISRHTRQIEILLKSIRTK